MSQRNLAVFSDIHSNLEALEAVLADMDSLKIGNRVCLGDVVGYGPSPSACLKRVRALDCPILLGNHDEAVSNDLPLENLNEVAVAGIEYSREKLTAEEKDFLRSRPFTASQEGCQFVHSSLIQPAYWIYITSELEAHIHFSYQEAGICFNGHTHVPMVWQKSGETMATGRRGAGKVKLEPNSKYLINVGGVGQPRDLNPRACYVIYRPEEKTVEFRRVKYDITKTKRKIARAKLPKYLGERLLIGQ
jgi:diadenosine tetraphosphatase ApaH/serine/threonine PP2A family protein phosphatase